MIKRGDRIGVRVKDAQSPVRTQFKGLDYFPVSPAWRVTGTFVPYDTPKKVEIPTVLGTTETMEAPGVVKLSIDGKEVTLEPVVEDPKDPMLWFIFKDATSNKETYGGGRFLYADMPKDGKVVVDFNQAYNPPCAFTPYATCPLPAAAELAAGPRRGGGEEVRRRASRAVMPARALVQNANR